MVDFNRPVAALTRMKVPRNFNGRNAQSRRDLAITLQMRAGQLDQALLDAVHARGVCEAHRVPSPLRFDR